MTLEGPAWVGIGAQRSGTTWLTDLIGQHPDISVAPGKERHAFDRGLLHRWTETDTRRYRATFAGMAGSPGEFTPYYLRAPWAADIARVACPDSTLFIVILRDPVERDLSALRWEAGRRLGRMPLPAALERAWIRRIGSDTTWGGCYAAQLDVWSSVVGRERLLVLQYERARQDPAAAVRTITERLGLGPHVPSNTTAASRTSTDGSLELPDQLRARLAAIHARDLPELTERWGIDASLWPATSSGA